MSPRRALSLVALALGLAGCFSDEAARPLAAGDDGYFASGVQPILASACANPSCHGRPGPLELYATRLHRRDPAQLWLLDPLDAGELRHNQREIEARIDLAAPERSPVLNMARGGESGHSFGAIFEDDADRDYRALRDWVLAAAAGAP